MVNNNKNPLGTEPVGKLIFQYAIPSVISLVVNSLYNMVDQVFIGRGVGYMGNAATNVILPLILTVMALSLLICNGASAYLSLQLGKGDKKSASKSVGNMITLSMIMAVVVTALTLIFLKPVCRFFGGTGEVLDYAVAYGRIIAYGFPAFVMCCGYNNVVRADGRPMVSMFGMVIGCVINLILDPLFIFVFGWGVEGAAWATIIGEFANALYFIYYISKPLSYTLTKKDFVLDFHVSKSVLALGLASFFTQVATVLVIALQNNLLVIYGARSIYGPDITLAAFGITVKVNQIVTSISLGISIGVQPVLGFNYGSRQFDRVKKAFRVSLGAATAIMIVAYLLFHFIPEFFINIFGTESDLYMEFAVKCFRIFLGAIFFIPSSMICSMFLQGLGKPLSSGVLSLLRQIVLLIPATLLLTYLIGVEGVLYGGPVSDVLSGLISLGVVGYMWKKLFPHEERVDGLKAASAAHVH